MWDDVLGHQQQKDFLSNYLTAIERPHALLFIGAEGLGKKQLALQFAKTLLCSSHNGQDNCESCRLMNLIDGNFSHPDFLFIQREVDVKTGRLKDISLEQIKNLITKSAFAPIMSKVKVCIIEDIDRMSEAAANSFLKLLEEPPSGWVFVLLATDEQKLLTTILSRVVSLHFYGIEPVFVQQILVKRGIEKNQAEVLAQISEGSIGAAISLSSKDVFYWRQQAQSFLEALPLTASENYLITRTWQQKECERQHALLFVKLLFLLMRDMLICRLQVPQFLYNCDIKEAILAMSDAWQIKNLKAGLNIVQEAYTALDNNAGIRLVLEAMALKIDKSYQEKE